jgi:multidrug efflux system outer membrane protein
VKNRRVGVYHSNHCPVLFEFPNSMRTFLILPSVVFLSSCVLGPQPGSPEVETPSAIRGDTAPHGLSFGDKAWRKVFTDSTLRSLIERALANNPDLVAATFRIEEARALAGAARADWFPTLDGSAGGTANYGSRNAGQAPRNGSRTSESYDLTGLLSWEIDLWGRIRRNNEAARARLLQAEYQRDAVQTLLIASVATAYIDLKNLDERLEISKSTAASREKSLSLVKARRDGGVSSDLEVGQAEALLGQAKVSIPVTEQAIAAKENEIRALLGEYPGSVVRGGSLERLESSLRIAGGLPASLLQRRPDVAAADQAFQAATAEIGVAEALRLPSLSLTGRGGMISADLNDLLEGASATYSIGPRLTGPIFDAGRAGFRVEAARARAQQALAAHTSAAKQAFREAADSLNAHVKTGEIIAETGRLVASLDSVAQVANDRFQGGASSYLEVLDAERSLFNAQLDFADARRNRLLAVVQAYRALGGGWK